MIEAIIQRIKDITGSTFVKVEMAEDLDAIFKGTAPSAGSLFVVPYRERAKGNAVGTGGFSQLVTIQFLTALVLRKHDDPKGGTRAAQYDSYKASIEAALAGWEVNEDTWPIELVGGESTPVLNNTTLYVQTWESTRNLTGD